MLKMRAFSIFAMGPSSSREFFRKLDTSDWLKLIFLHENATKCMNFPQPFTSRNQDFIRKGIDIFSQKGHFLPKGLPPVDARVKMQKNHMIQCPSCKLAFTMAQSLGVY